MQICFVTPFLFLFFNKTFWTLWRNRFDYSYLNPIYNKWIEPGTNIIFVSKIFYNKSCSHLKMLGDRGWLIIQARQIGYNAVSLLYLAKSTLLSNNFIIKLWLTTGGGGVGSFFGRLGGRPRLGTESWFSSSSPMLTTSCRAPFNRPRAACTTSVAGKWYDINVHADNKAIALNTYHDALNPFVKFSIIITVLFLNKWIVLRILLSDFTSYFFFINKY